MAKPGDTLNVPLAESEFLAGLMKVKPTAEMPRPGAHAVTPKKRGRKPKLSRKAKASTKRSLNLG
jgi:hypothetical protein